MVQNDAKPEMACHSYIGIGTCNFCMTNLNFLYRFPAVLERLYDENGNKWHKIVQNDAKPEVPHHAHIVIGTCKLGVTHLTF